MTLIAFFIIIATVFPVYAQSEIVSDHFLSTDYPESYSVLDSLVIEQGISVDYLYWKIRLESDPEELKNLLSESKIYFANFPEFESFVKAELLALELASNMTDSEIANFTESTNLSEFATQPAKPEETVNVVENLDQPIENPEQEILLKKEGRFFIQFAAFSDRTHAIRFISAWQDVIPGLVIKTAAVDVETEHYKIWLGSWKTRPNAESARLFYQNKYELESMIISPQ